ncbi:MAG TPA: 50S ribosomal protein L4 [Myxococcales bacterium]|nr:50S ribosomal protein L4 [Myxococcales bacterium]HIL80153.1 50S ribosomal protein L4 [Myxococcales bacterium]
MATADIITIENKKSGSMELDPTVFDGKVRPHLYHAEVRRQLALRHAGTHSTKNRAAVSGGGAKPHKQKGTGRARQGTRRAVQWAGGGVAFGPVPREYGHKLPKKMRRAALVSALSQWQQEGSIIIVDELELDEYKTRRVVETIDKLGLSGAPLLLVIEDAKPMLEASVRNIPRVGLVRVEGLNVYDVLRHPKVLITRAAVEALHERLGTPVAGGVTA